MNEALGWIKMYRSILEWDWWSDHNVTRLFLYFLVKANSVDKKWRGIVVKRGSFVTGLTQISEETGLSIQQLRTAIEKLKSTGEITDESTSQYRIVTICNYDKYQVKQDEYQQTDQQSEQHTNNSQSTDEQQTNNNNKEDKKESNIKEKEDTIVSSKKKFSFFDELVALGVKKDIATDWMKIRKTRKATDSETAFKQLKSSLDRIQGKFNLSCSDIIKICVVNGWYGCKASYFDNIRLADYDLTTSEQQQDLFSSTNNTSQETVSPWGVKYQ